MNDFRDLKAIAEACQQHQPLRFMRSHGALYIRNDNGIVFDVHQNRSFPEFMAQNKDYADLVLAASPAAVLELIAKVELLVKQLGDRPAYRTPEYESKRDAMWRRAHMVATSKGYDHINMAIAAAPTACADCMGCGGEWQGEGRPNSVCEICKGNRGKTLEAERDKLKAENADLKTGYEAYERVNAELRAECEKLRTYGEEFASLAERRREQVEALRKDAERLNLDFEIMSEAARNVLRFSEPTCMNDVKYRDRLEEMSKEQSHD